MANYFQRVSDQATVAGGAVYIWNGAEVVQDVNRTKRMTQYSATLSRAKFRNSSGCILTSLEF